MSSKIQLSQNILLPSGLKLFTLLLVTVLTSASYVAVDNHDERNTVRLVTQHVDKKGIATAASKRILSYNSNTSEATPGNVPEWISNTVINELTESWKDIESMGGTSYAFMSSNGTHIIIEVTNNNKVASNK